MYSLFVGGHEQIEAGAMPAQIQDRENRKRNRKCRFLAAAGPKREPAVPVTRPDGGHRSCNKKARQRQASRLQSNAGVTPARPRSSMDKPKSGDKKPATPSKTTPPVAKAAPAKVAPKGKH
jgi:hypothetical protein